jgi:hypothetical protein
MELECHEPGCPPLDTVIAAMEEGKGTRYWKLHKPIPEVTRADLDEHGCQEAFDGLLAISTKSNFFNQYGERSYVDREFQCSSGTSAKKKLA